MKFISPEFNQAQFTDYKKQIQEDIISDFFVYNEAVINHKKQLHHDQKDHE